MMAVVGTLAYNFTTVFPLFVTRSLGGTDTTFTLLFSVVSVGALVGALVSARRTHIDVRHVAITSIAFGVAMALMTVAPGPAVAFPVALLVGLGSIAFLTASTSIVQLRSDPTMRGRVLALQAMVFLGSTPIGGPILGWICQELGPRYGVAVGAIAAVGAGVWGLAVVRRDHLTMHLSSLQAEESVEAAIADLDDDLPPVYVSGSSPNRAVTPWSRPAV
jgi:MFS family permease